MSKKELVQNQDYLQTTDIILKQVVSESEDLSLKRKSNPIKRK